MDVKFFDLNEVDERQVKYAVIAARHRGKWVLCKNKRRAWELPGGHLEHGESPAQAAERELFNVRANHLRQAEISVIPQLKILPKRGGFL